MYDEHHITHDAATVRFDDSADGITVDEDGPSFDWDEVEVVRIDNPPHATAFDSKRFYKIPATVARPIPQPYEFGDSTVWLKKPREELKKSAWSLDNAPWTMGHPDTGMVKSVDDVRGFWRNPRYLDGQDDLDADLHVPVGDEEAKEYLEENADVSVGFYNRIARVDEYDGVVGGADDDDVDIEGYQTEMLFDHCASVGVGRCSSEAGCGIDARPHGHVSAMDSEAFKRGTRITDSSDEAEGPTSMEESTDAGRSIDGTWYAVPPEDTEGEEPKYPIDNCSDVQDAWRLRAHGEGLSIEQSTLESRIRSRADSLDCEVPDSEEDSADAVDAALDRYDIEADGCGCGCGGDKDNNTDTTMDFEFDDLSTKAALAKVESQHDGVSERLEDLREAEDAAEEAEAAAEELGLDDVSDLADKAGLMQERIDELQEQVDELQRPAMEEDAEAIASLTDRFGEDADEVIDNLDADPEKVADKRELVEDLAEGYDEATANSGGDEPEQSTDGGSTGPSSKYAKTPW